MVLAKAPAPKGAGTGREIPRVLQFCHSYYGPFLDCARQYSALFTDSGYLVTTVYLTGEPSAEVIQGSGSDEVIFLGYGSADMRGLKLGAMRKLRRIVKGGDFRLCIAHRFKPLYIALLSTNLPVIGVHHAFGDYARPMRRLFANFFRTRLALLGVSDAVRDDLRLCLPNWPGERIETLYNRIDVGAVQAEQLPREASRQALGLPGDAWVVGNVGRLHPDKDQATLIEGFARALPELPENSLLTIIGQGRLESSLQTLAQTLGVADRVRFLGQVPSARRYFKAFDVFALTSDHEPFGMVLLEAMAAGVPLIASDCGGAPEVVGEHGASFPFGDASALAAVLVKAVPRQPSWATDRLARFTDECARRRFWKLPAIRPFVLS